MHRIGGLLVPLFRHCCSCRDTRIAFILGTDFFSDLGLQPTYVKPEVYAAAPKKKTLQMVRSQTRVKTWLYVCGWITRVNVQQDMTLDEDIDIDGWEAGTSRVTFQPPSDQPRPGEWGKGWWGWLVGDGVG